MSPHAHAAGPGEDDAPFDGALVRAGLWSFTLQALADRCAHDVNNALNDAIVNLEVVKVRARPGADAGAVASFAEAAAQGADDTARVVAALLGLVRAPRGTPDVARVAADAVTLLAPGAAQRGVTLELAGPRSCPVAADPIALRLGVVTALLAALDAAYAPAPGAETVGFAGADPANDPPRVVRCTTMPEPRPTFEVAPRGGALVAPLVQRALGDAGIALSGDGDALRLALPVSQAP